MRKFYYIIDPDEVNTFLSSFKNTNPFSLKREMKDYYKNGCKNTKECLKNLTNEIHYSLLNSTSSSYIYWIASNSIGIVKLRIKDYSSNSGKSGGWRIIGLVDKIECIFILLSVYRNSDGKNDLTPIEKKMIKNLCNEYFNSK